MRHDEKKGFFFGCGYFVVGLLFADEMLASLAGYRVCFLLYYLKSIFFFSPVFCFFFFFFFFF